MCQLWQGSFHFTGTLAFLAMTAGFDNKNGFFLMKNSHGDKPGTEKPIHTVSGVDVHSSKCRSCAAALAQPRRVFLSCLATTLQLHYKTDIGALTPRGTAVFTLRGAPTVPGVPPLSAGACTRHTVAAGEMTWQIADRYSVHPANILSNPDNKAAYDGTGPNAAVWPRIGAQLTVCADA